MPETSGNTVLCFGELLWDCLPRGLFPGGAPFNVAYHLGRLGLDAVPVTAVGDDFLGNELLRRLEGWGLDTALVTRRTDRPTGVVQAALGADGSATYEIATGVAWDWIEPPPRAFELAKSGAAIVYGTLAQRSPSNRERLNALLDAATGGLKVYDVNLRPPFDDPALAARLAARADLVKLNDEELHRLTGGQFAPDAPDALEKAARAYAGEIGRTRICVTAGGRGAGFLDRGEWHWAEGRPVAVKDTVGAGDAFLAALIAGLLGPEKRSPGAILRRACRLGEFVASSEGATPRYTVADDGTVREA